ncbi:uncharacterized protein J5F26_002856 isoform 2-T4 [Ciconia maguari]
MFFTPGICGSPTLHAPQIQTHKGLLKSSSHWAVESLSPAWTARCKGGSVEECPGSWQMAFRHDGTQASWLVKGKKKKPLPNLKTLEYVVQFPGLYATSFSVLLRQPVANSRNRTWAEHAVSVQPFHILFIKSLRTCFTEMFRYLISIDSLSLGT